MAISSRFGPRGGTTPRHHHTAHVRHLVFPEPEQAFHENGQFIRRAAGHGAEPPIRYEVLPVEKPDDGLRVAYVDGQQVGVFTHGSSTSPEFILSIDPSDFSRSRQPRLVNPRCFFQQTSHPQRERKFSRLYYRINEAHWLRIPPKTACFIFLEPGGDALLEEDGEDAPRQEPALPREEPRMLFLAVRGENRPAAS